MGARCLVIKLFYDINYSLGDIQIFVFLSYKLQLGGYSNIRLFYHMNYSLGDIQIFVFLSYKLQLGGYSNIRLFII